MSYELDNFELEMHLTSGWSVVRANEHEVAAYVLDDKNAVSSMLTGAEVTCEDDNGVRWRCRLTPKSWLVSP
jgi:hypothetical protein